MGEAAERAGRTVPALAACVALLSVWVVLVRPGLPPVPRLPAASSSPAARSFSACGRVWTPTGLALSPRRVTDGLRYGGLAFGAVMVVILLGVAIPSTRESVPLRTSGRHGRAAPRRGPPHDPAGHRGGRGAGLPWRPARAVPADHADVAGGRRVLGALRPVARPVGAGRDVRLRRQGGRGGDRHVRGDLRGGCGLLLAADPLREPAGTGDGAPGAIHSVALVAAWLVLH